jgi:membrane fusion protein, heavy metal efflux system
MWSKYSTFELRQQFFFALICILLFSLFLGTNSTLIAYTKKVKEAAPLVIRQGDEMVVPEDSPLRARLVVAPVGLLAAPHAIALPGVVEADPTRVVSILPPLTGRLTDLEVNLGDAVKQGQLLAVIYSPDLDQAYADVDKARDAFDLASKALERARHVHEAGGISVKELEQFNSAHEQALAEFRRAEARLNILKDSKGGLNDRALSIKAPISGTVTSLGNGKGSYITDPTASLMTIANLDKIWVTANIPENLISSIEKGQEVDVQFFAYPHEKFHGKISFINALLESDTHRNKARIAFDNPDNKLKPNMYATVTVEVPQTEQIVIPSSALLMNNDNISVFVEVGPGAFVRHTVTLGNEDGDHVRILSGLKADDRVVTSGGVLLND